METLALPLVLTYALRCSNPTYHFASIEFQTQPGNDSNRALSSGERRSFDARRVVTQLPRGYASRPYVAAGSTFDDYGPAFGYGLVAYERYRGRSFDDMESDLARDWSSARGRSNLDWALARNATQDAWNRLSRSPGR